MSKKKSAQKARYAAKAAARKALMLVGAVALAEAVVSALGDVVAMSLAGDNGGATAASVVTLVAMIAVIALSIVFIVRAYRAIMNCCEVEPDMSEKVTLGAALWFGSSLPSNLVAIIGNFVAGGVNDLTGTYVSAALGVICVALAYGMFRKEVA